MTHSCLGSRRERESVGRSSTLQSQRSTTKSTIPRTNGTRIIIFIGPSTWTNPSFHRRITLNRSIAGRWFPICFPKTQLQSYSTSFTDRYDLSIYPGCECQSPNYIYSWIDSVMCSTSRVQLVSDLYPISFPRRYSDCAQEKRAISISDFNVSPQTQSPTTCSQLTLTNYHSLILKETLS